MLHLSTRKSCSNNRVQPFAFPENKIARWALANNRAICDRYHRRRLNKLLCAGMKLTAQGAFMMTKNIIVVAAMFLFALTVGVLTADSSNDRASSPTIPTLALQY
jgi:hypothetical protein